MTDTLRILLELEPHADPARGRVFLDGCQPHRFDGYVQLIGLLEALRSDRGRETGDDPGGAA